MAGKIQVAVSDKTLDIGAAHDFVADPAHGAVNCFIGAVRDKNMGRNVVGVSYDVFEPLAQNVLQGLCERVRDEYGGKINIHVSHFKGRLDIGGVSVIIAVSTPHRDESFSACRMLIEELKRSAPIWKQEHYTDGDSEWVQGHALCQHDHDHDHSRDRKKHACG